jgi:hypothetical protein
VGNNSEIAEGDRLVSGLHTACWEHQRFQIFQLSGGKFMQKKSTRFLLTALASTALTLGSSTLAKAAGESTSSREQSGRQEPGRQQAGTQQRAGHEVTEETRRAAQNEMAPHTVMIETSLISAMDHLKGLKAALKVNENRTSSATFVQHYKLLAREIQNNLKNVKTHEGELMGTVQSHPEIANTNDFKAVQPALNDLHNLNSTWQSKVSDNDYWKNIKAVTTDIDRLENQINTALDKVKSLNSSQLHVSNVG